MQVEGWKGYFPRIDGFQTCEVSHGAVMDREVDLQIPIRGLAP